MLRALPFALFAVLLAIPAWVEPAHRLIGRAEGELRDHLWVAWLVQRRVLDDGALPLHFPLANFPYGLDLYPLDPLNQAFLTALAPAIGLVPAITLLTTALLALVGVGGDRLARACGASSAGGWAGGALCMLGPPLLGPVIDTQTEGMAAGWMLLLLSELAAPWDRARALRAGLFGAALVASAPYQAHGIALVAVPLALWQGRRLVWIAAVPVLVTAGTLGTAMWHAEGGSDGPIASRARNDDPWPPRTVLRGTPVAPQVTRVSTASPDPVRAYPRTEALSPPTTGPRRFAGWCLPALVLLAAVREPRARWLLAGSGLYASLALGSARDYEPLAALEGLRIPLPYDLYYRWYPLGDLAWKPAQFAIPAWALACAALASLRLAPVAALTVAAELQLTGPTPLPLPVVRLGSAAVYADLAAREGAVVEFPCRTWARGGPGTLPADVLLGQLLHGLPIGENHERARNPLHRGLLEALAATLNWPVRDPEPLADAWRRAAAAGYRWLVVHGDQLSHDERGMLTRAVEPLRAPATSYDDAVVLYALEPR